MRTKSSCLKRASSAQVGSPLELYNAPANKFVAAFIGSPSMNFVPVEIVSADGAWASIRLTGAGAAKARLVSGQPAAGAAELGVRPEHFLILPAEDSSAKLPGKVAIIEHLGNTTILYVDTPVGQLIVEGKGDLVVKPGDTLGLKIDEPRAHLFGPTGAAL